MSGAIPNSTATPDSFRTDARDARIAVSAREAGRLFGIAERSWRRLDSSGQVPRPIRVGSSVRWLVQELEEWGRQGCPDRARWEANGRSGATPAQPLGHVGRKGP